MENIQNLTEKSTVPNINLGVVLTDSASSLTQGVLGMFVESSGKPTPRHPRS